MTGIIIFYKQSEGKSKEKHFNHVFYKKRPFWWERVTFPITSFLVHHSKKFEDVMNDTAGIKSQKIDSET